MPSAAHSPVADQTPAPPPPGLKEQWRHVVASLSASLSPRGLDITCPLAPSWYNSEVDESVKLRAPEEWNGGGSSEAACLAVLVGNSRALWMPFLQSYCSSSTDGEELRKSSDPLQLYVKRTVTAAAEETAAALRHQTHSAGGPSEDTAAFKVYWSHETSPGKLVAIQRMAAAAGLAYFDKESYLCIHPTYGAWFSLRAVVLFPVRPSSQQPPAMPCPLSDDAAARVKAAFTVAMQQPYTPTDLNRRTGEAEGASLSMEMPAQRQVWLAVRDAIEPQHPMRYCDHQVFYHYTRRISFLKALLQRREQGSSGGDSSGKSCSCVP